MWSSFDHHFFINWHAVPSKTFEPVAAVVRCGCARDELGCCFVGHVEHCSLDNVLAPPIVAGGMSLHVSLLRIANLRLAVPVDAFVKLCVIGVAHSRQHKCHKTRVETPRDRTRMGCTLILPVLGWAECRHQRVLSLSVTKTSPSARNGMSQQCCRT